MAQPPIRGDYTDNTGEYYSNGTYHGAHDYNTPIGVPIYAVNEGFIIDAADGSPNDGPGDANYPGEPSNWITLGTNLGGRKITVFYQHLSPGLNVRKGQSVKEGAILGRTGNSGNSTGPHLHFAAMWGWQQNRYANYSDHSLTIYPPDIIWKTKEEDIMASLQDLRQVVREVVWEHKVETDNPKNKITFDVAIDRWNRTRSAKDIAEISARMTVRALKETGLADGVDEDAIVKKVIAGLKPEV